MPLLRPNGQEPPPPEIITVVTMGDSILKLDGKTALVFGVASEESIAYAICKSLSSAGCNLVLGFQPRFRSRIQQLLPTLPKNTQIHPIDVNKPDSISNFYKSWQAESPGQKANIVIHAIGFAPREAFDRNLLFVDSDPIDTALRISAHSLQSILRSGLPHLAPESSTITLTYAASTRHVPSYGLMSIAKAALEAWVREIAARLGPDGHRVNAISAGPIKTLAASGIPGFEGILDHVERNSPLRRNVDQMDVAGAATWLASPLSSGVTAQVIHVDGGYSSTMVPEDVNR